jgi:hypothetical protein
MINAALQQNRLLLQKLLPPSQSNKIVTRHLLQDLGFRFDLVTGYSRTPEGKMINKIYEFPWHEVSKTKISIDPNLDTPVHNLPKLDAPQE